MKPIAVFDIDGTLIRWQLYHAVVDSLLATGNHVELREHIQKTRKKWKQREHALSFREYENAVVEAYESVIQTLTVAEFNKAVEEVVLEHKEQVYTFTRDLIASLKKQKYFLLAISGSQTELVKKIATYYGFDDYIGTEYVKKDGRFTGEKIHGGAQKGVVLQDFMRRHDLSIENSFAVGDSESDIPMLAMVTNPIAFNPTKALLNTAQEHGWEIVVERKNVIYKLTMKNGHYILA